MDEATELQRFFEEHGYELSALGLFFLRLLHADMDMMVMSAKPSPVFCATMVAFQKGAATDGENIDLQDLLAKFGEIDLPPLTDGEGSILRL